MTSMSNESPAPLYPPRGSSEPPSRKAAGSVVSFPSASSAQPSGIGSPRLCARKMWPAATWVVAMSSTSSSGGSVGMAMQMGLVETNFSLPPQGATMASPLVKAQVMSPARAPRSAQYPWEPLWLDSRMPVQQAPLALARSIVASMAKSHTTWPRPLSPSTTTVVGDSETTWGRACVFTNPAVRRSR